jgi:hypothetical protein
MAKKPKPFSPRFITETDERVWNDCTWCSGLMLANKATRGKYPSTRLEREALRTASGDHTGGSNLNDLRLGIEIRYKWNLKLDYPSWDELRLRLARGDGVLAQGLYNRLPEQFQRWDRNFANKPFPAHAVYVQGHDRGGNFHLGPDGQPRDVFWNDPLGRSPSGTPAAKRYRGEWMPIRVFEEFLLGSASRATVATVRDGEQIK